MKIILFFLVIFQFSAAYSQVTDIVILDKEEVGRLKATISVNPEVHALYDSIVYRAEAALKHQSQPLENIHFEGLLETDPKRIHTVKSFQDINHTATLIYAGYGTESQEYDQKIRQMVLAWAKTYRPDGNPINENKLVAFFWGYHRCKDLFSKEEQQMVESWIHEIALKQMNRNNTPNNNWEAKRLKIVGLSGVLLQNKQFIDHAIGGFKNYISSAYYPDGTSNDLRTRDALHYHISGIKPCLSAFINLSKYDTRFNLFDWESTSGSSIRKAVEHTVPYARGDKQRKEWTNSKVLLDKERAEAGIEEYRPGKLFNPEDARELFQWAGYYEPEWFSVYRAPGKTGYTSSWTGLLNSPLIRKK